MEYFTTDFVSGREISQYLGVCHGLGINENFGGAYNDANRQLAEAAERVGADAIIGMRYDSIASGKNAYVHVCGTAVRW
ncbi:MAG: heavy metal-binding domain-containing protein [Eubacterium sp.]|nr:heavy metal-binding domain-containing protein [Eubacterium sp.]